MSASGSKPTSVHRRRRPRTETKNNKTDQNEPPQWILDEILEKLTAEINTNSCSHNNHPSKDREEEEESWALEAISEAKSAQQQVYILKFIDHSNRDQNYIARSGSATEWTDAMRTGKNRLVLRIWKGGSRWWNLHRNKDPLELARSEIRGYQVARKAFEDYRSECRYEAQQQQQQQQQIEAGDTNTKHKADVIYKKHPREIYDWRVPKIPRVLHFHIPPTIQPQPSEMKSESLCWAILEYVGADENDNLTTGNENGNVSVSASSNDNDNDNTIVGNENCRVVKIDRSYLEEMIKIRREFGFDEPHPRWGRVPVDEALHYARSILNEVLLPLHRYSSQLDRHQHSNSNLNSNQKQQHQLHPQQQLYPSSPDERSIVAAITFSSMVKIYRQAWNDVTMAIPRLKHQKHNILLDNGDGDGEEWHRRIEVCLERLDRGISCLKKVAPTTSESEGEGEGDTNPARLQIPPLAPVLVHLDLQPQNLIFCSTSTPKPSTSMVDGSSHHDDSFQRQQPSVFSVLDWEDAAWADPRFDLVLLCRKVCANREQANSLWSEYAEAIAIDIPVNIATASLGPIEPWLRLETVHSIATMLLLSMDLVNGGRNPWETKKDLWGKLEREFLRLEGYET